MTKDDPPRLSYPQTIISLLSYLLLCDHFSFILRLLETRHPISTQTFGGDDPSADNTPTKYDL